MVMLRKLGAGVPVPEGSFGVVLYSVQTLYGGIDKGHATQGFRCQATKIPFGIPVNDDNFQILVEQFNGRSDSGKSTANYSYVKSRFFKQRGIPEDRK